jgi:hypothetical protein
MEKFMMDFETTKNIRRGKKPAEVVETKAE